MVLRWISKNLHLYFLFQMWILTILRFVQSVYKNFSKKKKKKIGFSFMLYVKDFIFMSISIFILTVLERFLVWLVLANCRMSYSVFKLIWWWCSFLGTVGTIKKGAFSASFRIHERKNTKTYINNTRQNVMNFMRDLKNYGTVGGESWILFEEIGTIPKSHLNGLPSIGTQYS